MDLGPALFFPVRSRRGVEKPNSHHYVNGVNSAEYTVLFALFLVLSLVGIGAIYAGEAEGRSNISFG